MPERREEAEKSEIIFQRRRIGKQFVRVVKSMRKVKSMRVVNSMRAHGHAGRREKSLAACAASKSRRECVVVTARVFCVSARVCCVWCDGVPS